MSKQNRMQSNFRLLILLLTLMIMGVVFSALTYYHDQKLAVETAFREQLNVIADLKAGEISSWLDERNNDALKIQQNRVLPTLVQQFLEDPANKDFRQQLLTWLSSFEENGSYANVLLLDNLGQVILRFREDQAAVEEDLIPTMAAIRSGQITLRDFYSESKENDKVYLDIIIPLRISQASKNAVGAVILRINPEKKFYPLLNQWPISGSSGETLLVKREGDAVVYLNPLRYSDQAPMNLHQQISQVDIPEILTSTGKSSLIPGKDYRGIPVLAVSRLIPNTRWILIAKVDQSEIYAPWRERTRWMVLLVVSIFLTVSMLISMLWRRQQLEYFRHEYRAEQDSLMLSQRFQSLMHYANDMIFLLDGSGCILDANDSTLQVLNLSMSRLMGMHITDLVELNHRNEFQERLARLDETQGGMFESQLVCSDGKRFPAECSARMLYQQNTKYYQLVIRDITERKQSEDHLRESEQRFRTFYEQAPVRYQSLDSEGNFLDVNQAWLDWMQIAEKTQIVGTQFSNWLIKEDRGLFARQFKVLKTAGFIRNIELRLSPEDGRTLYVVLQGRATFSDQGQFILAHCILQDITAQKLAEDSIRHLNEELEARVLARTTQLEAANKELEAFSYSVSHDLRAPLRAMDGFSKILMEDYADQLDEDARHYLELVRQNTTSMSQLIDDLLAFSRLSRQPLKLEKVQPGDLVQQSLDLLSTDLVGREIQIQVDKMPECEADPILLKQVYVNLLSNAIKFTRKTAHAVVEVGALNENHHTIYFVKDNGVGFDMQYAPKLFGVFQRLHRVEEYEGTGVGLAIVQRIVRRHNGKVWAEGIVNEGATFCFTLNNEEKADGS